MAIGYVRPEIQSAVYRDETGAIVTYGSRWGGENPPAETYSVVTHPERFEPLLAVAEALVEYLASTFEVAVREEDVLTTPRQPFPDPSRPHPIRVCQITPSSSMLPH